MSWTRTRHVEGMPDRSPGHWPNTACDIFYREEMGAVMVKAEPGEVRYCCERHFPIIDGQRREEPSPETTK